jgi:hypothetical protein
VAPLELDLLVLRTALDIFGQASGLFANLEKSIATPLHCEDDDIARIHDILACRVESFPCRYLGIPLSIFRLRRGDEQGLIDAVASRIPRWKGNLLNIAGRTALVKSTLSAIPVHTAIAVCLSQWALKRIDKLHRGFIWTGTATASGGRCRVAWPAVCRPSELGGLGVVDLQRAGLALRLRWPWLRRTDLQRPWLGLPNKEEKATVEFFKAATVAVLGMVAPHCSGWTTGSRGLASAPWHRLFSVLCLGEDMESQWLRRSRTPDGYTTLRGRERSASSRSSSTSATPSNKFSSLLVSLILSRGG